MTEPELFGRDLFGEAIREKSRGPRLYNDAVLVTPAGTAGMRAQRIFGSHRKMVKTHQNVLVFCKGSPEKAAAKCKTR